MFTAHRWRTSESNDEIPYSHHPYAYALSNPINWSDPAGTCAVDDAGGPRACNPSFTTILRNVLRNPYYYQDRPYAGATPLNRVFEQFPEEAFAYDPNLDAELRSSLTQEDFNLFTFRLVQWKQDYANRHDLPQPEVDYGPIVAGLVILGGADVIGECLSYFGAGGGLHQAAGTLGDLRAGIANRAAPTELEARGRPVPPMERTMAHALNKESYLYDVAKKYGINLRGSGQEIKIVYDETMGHGTGRLGRTLESEGGKIIRIGPDALVDEATAANTIAHELSHARDYLRGVHKPHGDSTSMGSGTPYGSGNALEDHIRGNR